MCIRIYDADEDVQIQELTMGITRCASEESDGDSGTSSDAEDLDSYAVRMWYKLWLKSDLDCLDIKLGELSDTYTQLDSRSTLPYDVALSRILQDIDDGVYDEIETYFDDFKAYDIRAADVYKDIDKYLFTLEANNDGDAAAAISEQRDLVRLMQEAFEKRSQELIARGLTVDLPDSTGFLGSVRDSLSNFFGGLTTFGFEGSHSAKDLPWLVGGSKRVVQTTSTMHASRAPCMDLLGHMTRQQRIEYLQRLEGVRGVVIRRQSF